MTTILILVQLLAGFCVAMCGVILMFHVDIWTGLLLIVVGMFFTLRAIHRSNNATSN